MTIGPLFSRWAKNRFGNAPSVGFTSRLELPAVVLAYTIGKGSFTGFYLFNLQIASQEHSPKCLWSTLCLFRFFRKNRDVFSFDFLPNSLLASGLVLKTNFCLRPLDCLSSKRLD